MADRAWVLGFKDAQSSGDSVTLTFWTMYYGTNIAGGDSALITFTITDTDAPAQIRDKAVQAVIAYAQSQGYVITPGRVRLPSYVAGA